MAAARQPRALSIEVTQAVIGEWGAEASACGCRRTTPLTTCPTTIRRKLSTAVGELDRFGLSYLHIVEPGTTDPVPAGETPDLKFFRKLWRGPLIANKGYDRARAEAALRDGTADLVAFATLFLANPDLPERLRRGGPFNTADRKTFYGGGDAGYTDYPALDA